ncbi:Carbohydrate binding domain-containing protein [Clostridium cavendishii DSM 21758]|uniref:Carbohydrate binding domain-containing protein n=1 Tax=Clostridium cavendishii DSM 21758 TaxID=1121302 RepID=A0A1M6BBT6_9CLOT|nr:carbohydrate-binding protein [Clostridium cavendishii]SHI46182.1 Carbohydrate binding domain-containing protein [Clostridium cavendishii DSM 21758]
MKKWFNISSGLIAKLTGLALIMTVIPSGVFVEATEIGEKEDLVFSVMSDVHISNGPSSEDTKFQNALSIINSRTSGLDASIIAGDLTNSGSEAQYDRFMNIYNNYGNKSAQKLFVMGNHDYWNGLLPKDAQNLFKSKLGVELQTHKVIKGYHFIQVSTEAGATEGVFQDNLLKWLRGELEKAKKDNNKKPIFVTVHQHIKGTVYGSDDWGNKALYSVLKDYPQVVTFSGHSHYALNDERSIHQRDFTSVGTSSLSYMELESGKLGGSIPEGADKVSEGMLVKVHNNRVEVDRIDFTNNEDIKKPWIIENPSDKNLYIYTDERKNYRKRPYFNKDTKLEVDSVLENSAKVKFKQAIHDDLVHSYKIECFNKDKNVVDNVFSIFSGFYFGSKMPTELSVAVSGLNSNTNYEIRVYAIESFGLESEKPIVATIKTKKEGEIDENIKKPTADVYDFSFVNSKIVDKSSSKLTGEVIGNVKIEYEPNLKMEVAKFNGEDNNFIKVPFSSEQRGKISKSFSLETVFKMNKIGNQAIIENCEGGGIGFESTNDGTVEIWAHINGSYKRLGVKLEKDRYYHLLATYDGNEIAIYLNGNKVKSMAQTGDIYNPNMHFAIGADPNPNGGGTVLDGNIALARLYSKGLNASEARKLYKEYIARTNLNEVNTLVSKKPEIEEILLKIDSSNLEMIKKYSNQLQTLANEGVKIYSSIDTSKEQINEFLNKYNGVVKSYNDIIENVSNINQLLEKAKETISKEQGYDEIEKSLKNQIEITVNILKDKNTNVDILKNQYTVLKNEIDKYKVSLGEIKNIPNWNIGVNYKVQDKVKFNDKYYVCIMEHNSLESWKPNESNTLWSEMKNDYNSTKEYNNWKFNINYKIGDRVSYNGQVYKCNIGNLSQWNWNPERSSTMWTKIKDDK